MTRRKTKPPGVELGKIHLGDCEDVALKMPPGSVDTIFTDPPYIKELWENAYGKLYRIAAHTLKPSGYLITYCPQTHLSEIMDILRWGNACGIPVGGPPKLEYFWEISSLNISQSTAMNHQRGAICLHKPILVFQKPPMKRPQKCFTDVVRGKRQKSYHPWQQSIHDVLSVISRFMTPGQVLLDPFAGSGTSLIAGKLLGMQWIGCELNPETHAIACQRMEQQAIDLSAFAQEEEATA